MATVAPPHRLSPKVRRMLREHDLQARRVAGTGAGGRVTPHDVLAVAVAARGTDGTPLASPLARRLLRDAGLDLAVAADASDRRRLTSRDAERIIAERSSDSTTPGTSGATSSAAQDTVTSTEVQTDVARLLAALAAADSGFLSHNGFELTVEVAVASAVAAVLVRRPELAGSAEGTGGASYPSIHIGFVAAEARDAAPAVVPDVQYLTVAGLARRARAAAAGGDGDAPAQTEAVTPTLVVTTDELAPTAAPPHGGLGVLSVGVPAPLQVTGADELGHEVVRTRPHTTLRLQHDDRTPHDRATAFLEELSTAVATWSLPVGP